MQSQETQDARSVTHSSTHTATHCNTLQHTATHCTTLHHTASHCNTLQHTATHSGVYPNKVKKQKAQDLFKQANRGTVADDDTTELDWDEFDLAFRRLAEHLGMLPSLHVYIHI